MRNQIGLWVGIGVVFGLALGMYWRNLLVGLAVGTSTGLMIGVALEGASSRRPKPPRYRLRDRPDDRPRVER